MCTNFKRMCHVEREIDYNCIQRDNFYKLFESISKYYITIEHWVNYHKEPINIDRVNDKPLLFLCSFIDYVKRFATEEALRDQERLDSSDSESSMSEFSEDEAQDMEL